MLSVFVKSECLTQRFPHRSKHKTAPIFYKDTEHLQILPTISFLLTSGLLVMLLWDLITSTTKMMFISYFLGGVILVSLLSAAFIFSSPSNLVKMISFCSSKVILFLCNYVLVKIGRKFSLFYHGPAKDFISSSFRPWIYRIVIVLHIYGIGEDWIELGNLFTKNIFFKYRILVLPSNFLGCRAAKFKQSTTSLHRAQKS